MQDKFLKYLEDVINFAKFDIFDPAQNEIQISLLKQVKEKYQQLSQPTPTSEIEEIDELLWDGIRATGLYYDNNGNTMMLVSEANKAIKKVLATSEVGYRDGFIIDAFEAGVHHSKFHTSNEPDKEYVRSLAINYLQSLQKKEQPEKIPLSYIDDPLGCNICGGTMALIRGRYPDLDKRKVCPTCVQERLEQIQDISSPHYGKTFQTEK